MYFETICRQLLSLGPTSGPPMTPSKLTCVIASLGLPMTVTVCRSLQYKRKPARTRNARLISTQFPRDSTWMAGIHRRMDVVMEGLGGVNDRVTVLLLVCGESGYTDVQKLEYEAYLCARWRAPVSLRLAPVHLRHE